MKIEGFPEAIKALRELKTQVAKNVGRRALRPAAAMLASATSANAPVLTGNLKGNVKVDASQRSTKKRLGVAETAVVVEDLGATAIEYGTSDTPAFGYMRRAVDQETAAMQASVGSEIKSEVEKAAARAAKHAAKG